MSGNTQAGASTATSETKNNEYSKKKLNNGTLLENLLKTLILAIGNMEI